MLQKLTNQNNKIFLVDSIGALLSALVLGVVLPQFQEYIGMPFELLFALAITAAVFCFYSFSCYTFLQRNWRPFLKGIAIANLLYCVTTAVLVILFFQQLTLLGIIYFAGEIMVIGVLVYFELLTVKNL